MIEMLAQRLNEFAFAIVVVSDESLREQFPRDAMSDCTDPLAALLGGFVVDLSVRAELLVEDVDRWSPRHDQPRTDDEPLS
jgi:hypothetical protein